MQRGEAKAKLEAYLEQIVFTVWDLNGSLAVIRRLNQIKDSKEQEVYNSLHNFFAFVYRSSLTNLVLTLDRLFEEPRETLKLCNICGNAVSEISYGQRSLIWYLNQMKIHSTSFNLPQKFSDEEIEEQINWINNAKDKIEKIGLYRDKWFAHRDKRYFDNPQRLWEENPLLFEDLETLINLSNKIITAHFKRLKDADIDWTAKHIVGIDKIFNGLKWTRGLLSFLEEFDTSCVKTDSVQKIKTARDKLYEVYKI